ncbi:Site-specific recombinase XerD [Micrococcales bacterium KH10]|nr:Site-specific recombinase XerD [Micrococcales bacterium KH10]
MAYVQTRKNKDGQNRYVGRYRVDGRLKNTKTFTRKRDAEDEATRLEDAAKRNDFIDPAAAEVTLDEFFKTRQAARSGKAPRTLETESERYRSLIAPRFGSLPLKRIATEDIADWSANMPAPRTGKTASSQRRHDALTLLIAVLDDAVDAGRLTRNPARKRTGKALAKPQAAKQKPHRYLSHEQLSRVALCANNEQARTMILLDGLVGLRFGELSALQLRDIDTLRWRIKVRRAVTRLDNGTLLVGNTKTGRDREVAIPGTVRPLILEQIKGKRPSDWLFSSRDGKPLRRESFSRNTFSKAVALAGSAVSELQRLIGLSEQEVTGEFTPSLEARVCQAQTKAGLEPTGVVDPPTWAVLIEAYREQHTGLSQADKVKQTTKFKALSRTTLYVGCTDFERLTLHDLRHTAASLAIASGATVKHVQKMLGHESAKMTLDVYAGLFEDDLDTVAESMSAAHDKALGGNRAHNMRTNTEQAMSEVVTLPTANMA